MHFSLHVSTCCVFAFVFVCVCVCVCVRACACLYMSVSVYECVCGIHIDTQIDVCMNEMEIKHTVFYLVKYVPHLEWPPHLISVMMDFEVMGINSVFNYRAVAILE